MAVVALFLLIRMTGSRHRLVSQTMISTTPYHMQTGNDT